MNTGCVSFQQLLLRNYCHTHGNIGNIMSSNPEKPLAADWLTSLRGEVLLHQSWLYNQSQAHEIERTESAVLRVGYTAPNCE